MTLHSSSGRLPRALGLVLGVLTAAAGARADADPHAGLFAGDRFPSAAECRTCHPRHYREWSVSQHAYTQLSPVFNAMQATITRLTNGTNGDFCIRCHTPVGMALGEPPVMDNLDRHPVSLEGVTCVACHRVAEPHGKFSGRVPLVEGDLHAPVYGPRGGEELERVLASGDHQLVTGPGGAPGRDIHAEARKLVQLTEPGFCGRCHDVTLADGFRLEEAFSEYKTSPAARAGVACQDCHMGRVPGDPQAGYDVGPAAVVGGVPTRPRKLTNHMIVGPDHSVVHPALFPHDPSAAALAEPREWLEFDVGAGWGTEAFEAGVPAGAAFPERWATADDRYDAREVVDGHLDLLREAEDRRVALLRRGYRLGEIRIDRADRKRLRFRVDVANGIDSHNVPTGFTAERLVYLRVRVTDAEGRVVLVSGDLDANGDLRDRHSVLVASGEVPRDRQLFTLQSRFLTRNVRGGEREQVLAVNHSVDPLPFIRPETVPTVLTGRPRGARIHKVGIEPGGRRQARYVVRGSELGVGEHRIEVELVAGMVPVNLIEAIQEAGFDYGLSAKEIADRIVAGHVVLWSRAAAVDIDGRG